MPVTRATDVARGIRYLMGSERRELALSFSQRSLVRARRAALSSSVRLDRSEGRDMMRVVCI